MYIDVTQVEDESKSQEAVSRIYLLVEQTFSVEVSYCSWKIKY